MQVRHLCYLQAIEIIVRAEKTGHVLSSISAVTGYIAAGYLF